MGWLYESLVLIVGIEILCCFIKNRRWKKKYENNTRIFQLVESSKDIVYHYQVKPERKFLYLSPSIEAFLGQGVLKESYNNPNAPFERIHPDDYDVFLKKIEGNLDYSKVVTQRWKDNLGEYRWFEEHATPIFEKGEFVAIQGIIRNIDDEVKLKENLEYKIIHDALTHIYNREFFERLMEKYNNHIDTSIALLLCDLDELKCINDNYGHKKGDVLIKETAKLLNESTPKNAMVSRIGGDEFAITMIHTNESEVENLYGKLQEEIVQYNLKSSDIKIKMSIGYSFNDHSLSNIESVFTEADIHMYKNKNAKKKELIPTL